MSKRIIAAFLASSIVFSLAACQNGGQKDDRIELSTRATESEDNGYISEPNQTIESTLGTTADLSGETTDADTTASTESSGTTA